MAVLDEISGFEFEDVMADVFRNLGYENVRQADRVADEGRDILMEETVDGRRRAVVVECKHTDTVGRPVMQKLHSAVATYDYDGPRRGMVVTSGRFTGPAREYVADLRENDDPHPIELIDGDDLRDIAEEVGLDLYNGRIEILCEETLRPFDPTRGVAAPVREAVRDIDNVDPSSLPEPELWVAFEPYVRVRARVDATFETSVGVIHRVDDREELLVKAARDGPEIPPPDVAALIARNFDQRVDLDEDAMAEPFDEVSTQRFGQTQTEYKEWAVERLQNRHTTVVEYTGDNNVTYTKTCEPSRSEVTVSAVSAVYVPRIRASLELDEYVYPYEYYAAGPSWRTVDDGLHRCQQCGDREAATFTFCRNCGSINCDDHIETERLTGDPICTGCAVTERFFYSEKYFFDESNREQFRAEYEGWPLHRQALENKPAVAAGAVAGVLLVVGLLVVTGVV